MRLVVKCRRPLIHIGITVPFLLGMIGCRSASHYVDRGNGLFDRGEYAEASLNYRKALQKDPKYGEAYHRLGLAEIKQNHMPEAFRALSLAVQLTPENEAAKIDLADFALAAYLSDAQHPKVLYDLLVKLSDDLGKKSSDSYQALRIKGYLALTEHRPESALQLFQRANHTKPKQQDIIVGLMEALYQSNRVADAERVGLDTIAADKTADRVYDALGRLYSATKRPGDAETILIRKSKENPKESAYILQLAGYYARAQKTAEMSTALRPLLTDPGAFPHSRRDLGDFYTALGDWPKAIEQFRAGAAAEPKETAFYQNRIARILATEEKPEEALNVLNSVIKEYSDDREARTVRAALLVHSVGKPNEGIREFRALIEKDPNDVALRYLFSRALLESGDTGGARAQLSEVMRMSPGFVQARLSLANLELESGQLNQAMQHADAVLARDPKNLRAHFIRGSALLGLGNLDQANSVFNDLLRQVPQSTDVRLELALLETRRKNFAAAEAAYKRILQSTPNEWRALAGLVDAYSTQQRPDRVFEILDVELQTSRGAAPVRGMLADAAVKAGKYDLAIEQYRQLAIDNPGSLDLQLQLARAVRLKGDVNGAIETLQKAATVHPDDVRPLLMLAGLFVEVSRPSDAKAQFRRALALRPDDPAILNNLAFLLADSADNLDEALKFARQADEKAPNNPDYADTLGWVYLKKGMNDNAAQIFRKLAAEHPDSCTFSYHLGVALHQSGDETEARFQLARALELRPTNELKGRINDLLARMN
jgi:tetratricopeptide (TPR) repeat protein